MLNNVKDLPLRSAFGPHAESQSKMIHSKYAAETHSLELSTASELLPIERRENLSCVGRFRIWRLLIVYATGRFQIGRRLTDHMAAMSTGLLLE